jgi:RNA polymerase I-specific transcription initiation factor RRN3
MELNTFFPFDPYRLPRSNSYIQGVYREWSSVAFDDDEDDEDEDDEDIREHEDGLDVPRIVAPDDNTGGLGESFGGMSISPTPNVLSMSVS